MLISGSLCCLHVLGTVGAYVCFQRSAVRDHSFPLPSPTLGLQVGLTGAPPPPAVRQQPVPPPPHQDETATSAAGNAGSSGGDDDASPAKDGAVADGAVVVARHGPTDVPPKVG